MTRRLNPQQVEGVTWWLTSTWSTSETFLRVKPSIMAFEYVGEKRVVGVLKILETGCGLLRVREGQRV